MSPWSAGLLPLGLTGVDAPVTLVALLLLVQGVGLGLLAIAYTDIVTATLEVRDRGVGGSLAQLTRTLGTGERRCAVDGVAGCRRGRPAGVDGFLAGYRYAFLTVAAACCWRSCLSLRGSRAGRGEADSSERDPQARAPSRPSLMFLSDGVANILLSSVDAAAEVGRVQVGDVAAAEMQLLDDVGASARHRRSPSRAWRRQRATCRWGRGCRTRISPSSLR